ncbi:MAG: MdtA/MuxA family multidrug efflux RND transporter periplasmic adaptor subunit [Glaciimonas sp.]|nr:MdtA/MuxA family multidrug efflux RND transporter periplasmic adaptor subunit [Glaciimonas sp.]
MNTNSTSNKPDSNLQNTTSRRWLWLLLIIALAVAAYFFWGRSKAPIGADAASAQMAGKGGAGGSGRGGGGKGGRGGNPNSAMPVGVAIAKTADVNIYLSGLGGVTPEATAIVNSRVDGQLIKLHFQEGQIVKAGTLLAELDPRPYQVAVTQAEGQIARDSAQLKAAQIDLQRYRILLSQDSIASQQVDTQAALVKQLEGSVKSDQGALDNARLQLSYSRITAPISGRIGLRQVDLGNIVKASSATGIVTITQLQPITTILSIAEDNIPAVMLQMQTGKKLPAEAWDRDKKNKLANGNLVTIDNQIDPATGTIKLKAEFPNTDYALFPNQFVNIRMLLETRIGATVIPNAAIQRGTKGQYVYVVKDDKTVTVRDIKTGPIEGELTAIESGIQVGDTIVVDGIDKLREGAKVEPIKHGPGGALADAMNAPDSPKRERGQSRNKPDAATNAEAAKAASK